MNVFPTVILKNLCFAYYLSFAPAHANDSNCGSDQVIKVYFSLRNCIIHFPHFILQANG